MYKNISQSLAAKPAISIVSPVMKLASSEQSNAAAAAQSSGTPILVYQ